MLKRDLGYMRDQTSEVADIGSLKEEPAGKHSQAERRNEKRLKDSLASCHGYHIGFLRTHYVGSTVGPTYHQGGDWNEAETCW